jgi:hypothetical protein
MRGNNDRDCCVAIDCQKDTLLKIVGKTSRQAEIRPRNLSRNF